jgi:hypothetical protein
MMIQSPLSPEKYRELLLVCVRIFHREWERQDRRIKAIFIGSNQVYSPVILLAGFIMPQIE